MADPLIQELLDIHRQLESFIARATAPNVTQPLQALENAAGKVGQAWSGSWIGYQAHVYYKDLQTPPPGAHFSKEWGFYQTVNIMARSRGDWNIYDPNDVIQIIEEQAQRPNTQPASEIAKEGKALFLEKRDQILSILEISKQQPDPILENLAEKARQLKIYSQQEYIENLIPKQVISYDSQALDQGFWIPPHISVLAKVFSLRTPLITNEDLAAIAKKAADHIERATRKQPRMKATGSTVFIGHGRSPIWTDLRDFIRDRLKLQWEEFNRVPAAGIATTKRLSEMLDSASIALLIMTAEDEQPDGKMRARTNVIHEIGLFQGRLGFG